MLARGVPPGTSLADRLAAAYSALGGPLRPATFYVGGTLSALGRKSTARMDLYRLVNFGRVSFRKLFIAALAFAAAPVAAQYEVKIVPGTRDLALEFKVSGDAKHPMTLATRGAAWGLEPQVQDVKCGKIPLARDTNGAWVVPPGCTRISWKVSADVISDGGGDPSKQRTLAVGPRPWFLLAEPTSILRPVGVSEPSSIEDPATSDHLVGARPLPSGRFWVPAPNNAPEFYVLGRAAAVERATGNFHVTYVADDLARVERLGLDCLHAKALSYLTTVVSLPKDAPDSSRTLLVIWLAAVQARGPLGGAAGSRSFVANYVIDPLADEKLNRAMTVAIVAHEQFHQLVDILRGPMRPLPAWLSESLAHYYGLKALVRAEDSQSAHDVRNQFVDPSRIAADGLLELDRRYSSGNRSAYGLFYSQGATLWSEVDSAIGAATGGKQSLDDYVKDLLTSPLSDDGSLPKAFLDRLRSVAGPQIDRIFERYVGR